MYRVSVLLMASFLISEVVPFKLRIVKFTVSNDDGSGMDGGLFGVQSFGGGSFTMRLCQDGRCCETSRLNTDNDDWERSEVDYFVGRQLYDCENFYIGENEPLNLTLLHGGSDGGKIDVIELSSDLDSRFAICSVGVKLDNNEEITVACQNRQREYDFATACNGSPYFCRLRFNETVFAGAHNSGTGQGSSSNKLINCNFKNHDLNVREQAELGIRLFDLDVIYSTNLPNCNGLETGHGKVPEFGLYRCFGLLEDYLIRLNNWLKERDYRDVIIIYIGQITFEDTTLPKLKEVLIKVFADRINDQYKTTKDWPTLGEAIDKGQNVFIFLRTESEVLEPGFLREIPVKNDGLPSITPGPHDVTVVSTYSSKRFGSMCDLVVTNAEKLCKLNGQFHKVSVIGNPFKQFPDCLWTIARKCNPRVLDAVRACSTSAMVNFILVDYPNYIGAPHKKSVVEIAQIMNWVQVCQMKKDDNESHLSKLCKENQI